MKLKRIILALIVSVFVTRPTMAQSIEPPTGVKISNQFIFTHAKLAALFGADKVGIICLSSPGSMPIVVLTTDAIYALNGDARGELRGKSFFVRGTRVAVTDPYPENDQRADFLGSIVPMAAKKCRGE